MARKPKEQEEAEKAPYPAEVAPEGVDDAPLSPESQATIDELIQELDPTGATFRKLIKAREDVVKSPRLITAADFRPVQISLPTGAVVEVRPVDLEALALSGVIPNPLREDAWRIAQDTDETLEPTEEEKEGKSPEEVRRLEMEAEERYRKAVDALVMNVVSTPRLVGTLEEEAAQEDVVWVGRLRPFEKKYILVYIQAPAVAFSAFRTE